ncbi:hypothetical protein ENBRE01_3433 [Enteropsectra breve]|nr:hypothetical protein ENBRE01_3433 [Enteropsectra breve]
MQRQRLTNDNRRRIIDAYIAGHSVQQISLMFQSKRPAIYAVIRKYRTSQSIYLQPHGGSHNKKLNDEHKKFIWGCIDADCGVTLKTG